MALPNTVTALLAAALLVSTVQAADEPSQLSLGDAARFARVFAKAQRGEPVTLGFIGGSITAGYAASTESNRYANQVAAWWETKFPKSQLTLVNAGIGGTGSNFGCLRVQADLLAKSPDVIVVEFSVNDSDQKHSALTYEGLVRQILSAPNAPACLLLFMSHDGKNAQAWHAKVGAHYGLPMVSYRDGLARRIETGTLKWSDISPDDIHPNDRGMTLAAGYVTTMLQSLLATQTSEKITPLPGPLFSDLYANVQSADADALKPTKNDGFTLDPQLHAWKADRPGSVIEFKVNGRGVSVMYYRIHGDMGQARVTIDGKHEQIYDAWFDQLWGGYRHTADVATDLASGEHVVRIELLETKSAQSQGHEFRILGLAGLGTTPSKP